MLKKNFFNTLYWLILGVFTLNFVWSVFLQTQNQQATVLNYSYNLAVALIYLLAAYIGIRVGAILSLQKQGLSLLLLGLASLAWAMGSITWSYYNLILKQPSPYPSVSDLFYLSFPGFFSLAMWFLIIDAKIRIKRKHLIQGLLIVLFTYISVFFIFTKPEVSMEQGLLFNLLNIVYPLTDAFLVSSALIVYNISNGNLKPYLLTILLAVIIQSVADIVFTYRQIEGNYFNGDVSDFLFMFSGFLLAFGIWQFAKALNKQHE